MIKTLTIVGPFATEYSLAKVNRALALALQQKYPELQVRLWADQENCDRLPGKAEYERYPFLKDLFDPELGNPDVLIYNNFPKSQYSAYGLKDLPGKLKFAFLAWEETIFPKRWAEECNQYLHGLLVTSNHVHDVFRASQVSLPMFVVSEGLDIPSAKIESYPVNSRKKFRFLHVSSGQYRKGVDVLLKAYFAEFTSADDVTLVLKIFPNASYDKDIDRILAEAPANAPEVVLIRDGNITDSQLHYLYENCEAVVLPSRAEGYGLPMAEAMQCRKPLITTAYSGHMDFCNEENCFLLGYELQDSKSHLNIAGAKLAEPDRQELQEKMRYLFNNYDTDEVKQKVEKAYADTTRLTWANAAEQVMSAVRSLEDVALAKEKKFAVVSTWNSRCGISEYSKNMYSGIISSFKKFTVYANSDVGDRTMADEKFVERVWQYGEMDFNKLDAAIAADKPDIMHFQYNTSFYSHLLLGEFIKKHQNNGIDFYITLHSVMPLLQEAIPLFNFAKAIIVHNNEDKQTLESWGAKNVVIVEHGLVNFKDENAASLRNTIGIKQSPVIASHGLIHDKKGILETLAAVRILKQDFPGILYLAINALNPNNGTSSAVFNHIQKYIDANDLQQNVILLKDFLPLQEVTKLLHLCDIAILAYGDVQEGASGAVRTCIGAHRPLIITNSYIFHNLNVGYRIDNNSPELIAKAVTDLVNSPAELLKEHNEVSEYAAAHSWEKVSLDYLRTLLQ